MTAASTLQRWRRDPVRFVRDQFGVEPDAWQADTLAIFPKAPRIAMKACKGPGKTAVLAWIAWNFLLTRMHPKVIATSITGDNLADGLWSEMAKWQKRSALLSQAFRWHKESIIQIDHPETWFMVPRTWPRSASPEQQADTLAGKHAENMLFLLDEAGGIPDAVMAAAEAVLANAGAGTGNEAHIVIAGNPTHLQGPLHRACTQERDLWHVVEITADPDDKKRTPRVSIEWAQQQIRKYGRDNPWVLVNVFGRFPPSSLNALLGPDDVRAAMSRHPRPEAYASSSRVIGVDVAREGDDASVMIQRQGVAAHAPVVRRNIDSLEGAGMVARTWGDWDADACFIDNTGGFGGGWLDQLRALGRSPIGVHFAGEAIDPRYVNKRAEMHFLLAEWVKGGGCLPDDPELLAELCAITYFFKGDRLQIVDKDQVKELLGRSPNKADALCLTFAAPVVGRAQQAQAERNREIHEFSTAKKKTGKYNPFARF